MFSFDKGHGSFGVPAEFVSDNLQATKVVMGKFFYRTADSWTTNSDFKINYRYMIYGLLTKIWWDIPSIFPCFFASVSTFQRKIWSRVQPLIEIRATRCFHRGLVTRMLEKNMNFRLRVQKNSNWVYQWFGFRPANPKIPWEDGRYNKKHNRVQVCSSCMREVFREKQIRQWFEICFLPPDFHLSKSIWTIYSILHISNQPI